MQIKIQFRYIFFEMQKGLFVLRYNSITVGERIRQARKELGWSQDKLIEQLQNRQAGIGRTTLSAIESGKKDALDHVSLSALCAMCDLFDCDMGYLLGEYEEKHRVAAEVCDATGLSETAVQRLFAAMSFSKNPSSAFTKDSVLPIDILSNLLSDGEFWRVINNLFLWTTPESKWFMDSYDSENAYLRDAEGVAAEMTPFADAMRDSQIASAAMHFSAAAARAVGWDRENKNAAPAKEPKQ